MTGVQTCALPICVFRYTTNAAIKTGDGMALAYRAGAPLKDMEFIQYHPTGLPFTGILITEAARSEGGYLLNKDGYRYLQDYNLGTPEPKPVLRSMELGPRDSAPGLRSSAGTVPAAESLRLAPEPAGAGQGVCALPHRPPPRAPPGLQTQAVPAENWNLADWRR